MEGPRAKAPPAVPQVTDHCGRRRHRSHLPRVPRDLAHVMTLSSTLLCSWQISAEFKHVWVSFRVFQAMPHRAVFWFRAEHVADILLVT